MEHFLNIPPSCPGGLYSYLKWEVGECRIIRENSTANCGEVDDVAPVTTYDVLLTVWPSRILSFPNMMQV